MVLINSAPDTDRKLSILSQDSRYDLACACGTAGDEHRRRSAEGKWIYPVVLPNGGVTFLFKTLLSNHCVNDCRYCPLRAASDVRRCSLSPEETVKAFLSYYRARKVSGLFLSSAVSGTPDETMEKINRTASYLRNMRFRGYIHLKIIPGASQAAITHSLSLASAVSLNIETAGEENFRRLSGKKDYIRDIVKPMEFIGRMTAKGARYAGIKHTTQFVVGASKETDREIIDCSWRLYKGLGLSRIYFSAYQRGEGDASLPGENTAAGDPDILNREHRLYQTDWLIRKYGFKAEEVPVGPDGNLSLSADPKEVWAQAHPEYFPVDANRDGEDRLLRVPGLGHTAVGRILSARKLGSRIRSIEDIGKRGKLLSKAEKYLVF